MTTKPTAPHQPTAIDRRGFNRLAAGASAIAAAGGFPALVRAQATKLKVGVILPRSGVMAQLGQSCQRGADISPGLVKELYGVDIELMSVDFETNVDTARSRTEKLINDGANVLIGAFDSGASGAIAQVAEQRKVPFVINIAAAPPITEQGYKFTFRNFPTSVDLIRNGLALISLVLLPLLATSTPAAPPAAQADPLAPGGLTWEQRHKRATFHLDRELLDQVRAAAQADGLSLSSWVGRALRAALDAR